MRVLIYVHCGVQIGQTSIFIQNGLIWDDETIVCFDGLRSIFDTEL